MATDLANRVPECTVLSLDKEDEYYMYHLRRGNKMCYVTINRNPDFKDFIDSRYWNHSTTFVSKFFKSLPVWKEPWATLTVTPTANGYDIQRDAQLPPQIPASDLPISLPSNKYFNFSDLQVIERLATPSNYDVQYAGKRYFCKISRFYFVFDILREMKAYAKLRASSFNLMPEFVGYIYEDTVDRVVGFLLEKLPGRHACANDITLCQKTSQQLHNLGFAHGDLSRGNFLVDEKAGVARLIDFTTLKVKGDVGFDEQIDKDVRELKGTLNKEDQNDQPTKTSSDGGIFARVYERIRGAECTTM